MTDFSQDPLPIGAAERDAIEQRWWDADQVLVYPQGSATAVTLTAYRLALLRAAAPPDAARVAADVAQAPVQTDTPLLPTAQQRRAALGPDRCGYLLGEAPYDLFGDGMAGPGDQVPPGRHAPAGPGVPPAAD